MTDLPPLYTTAEVAARFRRSTDWLYDQVDAGKANPMRTSGPGSPMLWDETDIAELEAALRPAPHVTKTRKPKRRYGRKVEE